MFELREMMMKRVPDIIPTRLIQPIQYACSFTVTENLLLSSDSNMNLGLPCKRLRTSVVHGCTYAREAVTDSPLDETKDEFAFLMAVACRDV